MSQWHSIKPSHYRAHIGTHTQCQGRTGRARKTGTNGICSSG
jgi:hypothetical protein